MIRWHSVYLLTCSLLYFLPLNDATAQATGNDQEVYLTFRHQGVVNRYITAYYREDGSFLLPHLELFQSLELPVTTDLSTTSLSGTFPSIGSWRISYQNGVATIGDRRVEVNADQFMVSELDYYLHPDLLYELFGLDFKINFNQLSVEMESDQTMPVVARAERERQRARAQRIAHGPTTEYYPLRYDRQRQILQGGFLDYNLTANLTNDLNSYLFQSAIGTEVAGGDLQGTIFSNWSQRSNSVRSAGLRWRYGVRDNPWITRITVGQTSSRGLLPVSFSGVQLSNEPLEPRLLYDIYRFRGRTTPGSEVELYRNNVFLDYQRSDEEGEYQFEFPLTYGTSRYNVRIYSPDGVMTERRSRIQIPYTFVPPGEVNYTLNAGRLDNPLPGMTERSLLTRGRVSTGITNWLTLSGGADYFDGYHDAAPTFSAGLTSRILQHYLISVEAADNVLYRTSANVIYPSGVNLGVSYDHYLRQGGIYNRSGNESRIQGNLFTPLQIGTVPLFFRAAFNREVRAVTSQTRYNMDLSSRIGRANIRISYRDTQIGQLQWTTTPSSRISSAVTYTFPRSRSTNAMVRGLYLRGQLSWLPQQSRLYDSEVQISRRILGNGRFQIAGGRNIQGGYNFIRMNLSFDFNRIRSNTSARSSRGGHNMTQGIRGSLGVSPENRHLHLNNRQQIGTAALAVRLFVDNSNSGTFEDGDELLPSNAIRIERGGGTITHENGVSYITMLQPYRQYNLSVNKSAFHNPLLLPVHEQFSVVTDPNQFKVIDIPLYMSGVIDGRVIRQQNGMEIPLSGARLELRNIDMESDFSGFTQELRSFSDGSFYAYEIPPGTYEMVMDPDQLDILDMRMDPEVLTFQIQSRADGDFLSGLEIRLIPNRVPDGKPTQVITALEELQIDWLEDYPDWISVGRFRAGNCRFPLQVGSYSTARRASMAAKVAEQNTGLLMEIYYNAIPGLYAVRTSESFHFSEAVRLAENHSGVHSDNELAIITQCDSRETDIRPVPVSFQIQLGAFHSKINAERLKDRLYHENDLQVEIQTNDQDSLYRVQIGPLRTPEAFALSNRIQGEEIVRELYIIQSSESVSAGLRFDYQLQAGRYKQIEHAIQCAEKLIDDLAEPAYILIDEDQTVHLMLKRRFLDWKELLRTRQKLNCNGDLYRPVIHLTETPVRL